MWTTASAACLAVLSDLGVAPGEPVSYHCIVYEVPLPELHWYRWPSSRSRLISNGCHWTDHFLLLNGFAEPVAYDVVESSDGMVNVTVELANGAVFTMAHRRPGGTDSSAAIVSMRVPPPPPSLLLVPSSSPPQPTVSTTPKSAHKRFVELVFIVCESPMW